MKAFLRLLLLAAIVLAPGAVDAQSTAAPTQPGYLSTSGCPTGFNSCFKPALSAIAGTQTNVTISGATALTIPTNAIYAVISVIGTNNSSGVCAYWQDDGTAPTGSTGQPLASLGSLVYFVKSLPIKLIAATGASCTFTASYYG